MKIIIINGPNLNLLGKRKPDIYGSDTLEDISRYIKNAYPKDDLTFFQSNHEGIIIDKIHEAKDSVQAIVINPGAFAHYSYAIHDAIEACDIPVVEVHLSDISKRETFRRNSVTAPACRKMISGNGKKGYLMAIEWIKSNSV